MHEHSFSRICSGIFICLAKHSLLNFSWITLIVNFYFYFLKSNSVFTLNGMLLEISSLMYSIKCFFQETFCCKKKNILQQDLKGDSKTDGIRCCSQFKTSLQASAMKWLQEHIWEQHKRKLSFLATQASFCVYVCGIGYNDRVFYTTRDLHQGWKWYFIHLMFTLLTDTISPPIQITAQMFKTCHSLPIIMQCKAC